MPPPRQANHQTSITSFFTAPNSQTSSFENTRNTRPRQLRLAECKKVVVLEKPAVLYSHDDILQLKQRLCEGTSRDEVLRTLRTLSCCPVGYALLKSTGVGVTVKALRKHPDPEIATCASKLLDKWRTHVVTFGCST